MKRLRFIFRLNDKVLKTLVNFLNQNKLFNDPFLNVIKKPQELNLFILIERYVNKIIQFCWVMFNFVNKMLLISANFSIRLFKIQ